MADPNRKERALEEGVRTLENVWEITRIGPPGAIGKGAAVGDNEVPYIENDPHRNDMSNSTHQGHTDDGLAVQEAKPKLKRPPLYKVLLLNDDYTPMDFVVHILEQFFGMSQEKATQIMLEVHTRGVGVCGVYSRDVAETKVAQVNDYSREHEHPLKCTMEEA